MFQQPIDTFFVLGRDHANTCIVQFLKDAGQRGRMNTPSGIRETFAEVRSEDFYIRLIKPHIHLTSENADKFCDGVREAIRMFDQAT